MKCNSKEDFARYQGVWVLCECRDGQLSDASIELVSEARRLADSSAPPSPRCSSAGTSQSTPGLSAATVQTRS